MDNGLSAVELVRDSLRKSRDRHSESTPFYTLILLDYSMPKMDGPTAAMKIHELFDQEKEAKGWIPTRPHIVCLTAFSEKIFETKARESGMNEFVSKPMSNQKLKQILKEMRLISLSESLNDV